MNWNKVDLRKKDKNLPEIGKRILWATNENSDTKTYFQKFFGYLEPDEKHIDTGYNRYKLTSNYWWMEVDDPEVVESECELCGSNYDFRMVEINNVLGSIGVVLTNNVRNANSDNCFRYCPRCGRKLTKENYGGNGV